MALRLVATVCQLALTAALNAGAQNRSFKGLPLGRRLCFRGHLQRAGEQKGLSFAHCEDDFAVVLLEDAAGEQIYVAEGFGDEDWKAWLGAHHLDSMAEAQKMAAAKAPVQEAQRGSVGTPKQCKKRLKASCL